MCGIFGIYGHEHAAAMVHLGLYSLQHRGQESSGIIAVDRERGAKAIKSMGLVSEALSAPAVEGLPGDIAIGHTRYSTAGSSTIENAQPMLARFRDGDPARAIELLQSAAEQLEAIPFPPQYWCIESRGRSRTRRSSGSQMRSGGSKAPTVW